MPEHSIPTSSHPPDWRRRHDECHTKRHVKSLRVTGKEASTHGFGLQPGRALESDVVDELILEELPLLPDP